MDENRELFKYVPLDRSKNEIRVVHLLPASDPSSQVECALVHVSLDNVIPYEALSYTWGSCEMIDYVVVDKRSFWITKNLNAALRALRYTTEDRWLWVDAICINQEDIPERNQEVLRMMSIYRMAEHVIVWIGEPSEDSGVAIDHLLELSKHFHSANPKGLVPRGFLRLTLVWKRFIHNFLHLLEATIYAALQTKRWIPGLVAGAFVRIVFGKSAEFYNLLRLYLLMLTSAIAVKWWAIPTVQYRMIPHPDTITALKALFGRGWFRRTWIIQEIAASRHIVVVCGSRTLPWDSLIVASQQIAKLINEDSGTSPYLNCGLENFKSLISISNIESNMSKEQAQIQRTLLVLLNSFSHMEATDPRDKVYAFLGLSNEARSSPGESKVLKPDYSQSVERIYMETARHLIFTSGCLDVLRACLGSGKITGLPSWVPDWTVTMARDVEGIEYWRKPFALPNLEKSAQPIASFSEDLMVIKVRGFVIGHLIGDERILFDSSIDYRTQKPIMLAAVMMGYVLDKTEWLMTSWVMSLIFGWLASLDPAGSGFFFEELSKLRSSSSNRIPTGYRLKEKASMAQYNFIDREKMVFKAFECNTTHLPLMWHFCDTYANARKGDLICMFIGAKVPFLVRVEENGEQKRHRLVGPASMGGAFRDALIWNSVLKRYKDGSETLHDLSLY